MIGTAPIWKDGSVTRWRALVVVRELAVRRAHLERARRNLDELESRGTALRRRLWPCRRRVVHEPSDLDGLQHRFGVLQRVTHDQLVQQAVADAAPLDHLAGSRVDLREIVERLGDAGQR